MSLRKYLRRIQRLDAMIRRKSTGPPEELARKLDISERWLYKLLRELKEEFDCPMRLRQVIFQTTKNLLTTQKASSSLPLFNGKELFYIMTEYFLRNAWWIKITKPIT